jgi:hypothetical protein
MIHKQIYAKKNACFPHSVANQSFIRNSSMIFVVNNKAYFVSGATNSVWEFDPSKS